VLRARGHAAFFAAGQDFDVVLVSFDPRDTPAIAAEKKRAHPVGDIFGRRNNSSTGPVGMAWRFRT
jgi:hypothetical protein